MYADRFARRGHNLILVARDLSRMEVVADRLRRATGVAIDLLRADLTDDPGLALVEARLRDDARIHILVNNAGANARGSFLDQTPTDVARLIGLNVTAVARLANAVSPRFAQAGEGAIINVGSAVALVPEFGFSVYGATKAFVLFLSEALHAELASKGVYVQAVLPAATRTEIWELSGIDVDTLPAVMEVDELVDAALVGFDRREAVTIPSLPNPEHWKSFEAARKTMAPTFNQVHAAARYRAQVA
jgi:short-subunit dehydrogenase